MSDNSKLEKLDITDDSNYNTVKGTQLANNLENPYVKNDKGEVIGKVVRVEKTEEGLIAYYKLWD